MDSTIQREKEKKERKYNKIISNEYQINVLVLFFFFCLLSVKYDSIKNYYIFIIQKNEQNKNNKKSTKILCDYYYYYYLVCLFVCSNKIQEKYYVAMVSLVFCFKRTDGRPIELAVEGGGY